MDLKPMLEEFLGDLADMSARQIAEKLATDNQLRCEADLKLDSMSRAAHCPIANYITARFAAAGHEVQVSVGPMVTNVRKGPYLANTAYAFNPTSVHDFIVMFDSGQFMDIRNDADLLPGTVLADHYGL